LHIQLQLIVTAIHNKRMYIFKVTKKSHFALTWLAQIDTAAHTMQTLVILHAQTY